MSNLLRNSFTFWLLITALTSLRFVSAEPDADMPLSPREAALTMKVPDGFRVTLFAGEPDVKQPIGFCTDDRGRLWVAEAYNYPIHGTKAGDRIIILEDTDNDGRHDNRTVFYDKLNYVTGIEVGFGGVWVVSPPYFYFIPDRDGDDIPDGEPQVLLDGLGNHANAHNLANGLAWGPDGWLYGTHGRTNWSMIGKPGTPDEDRIRFDGGVYRYHPVRHEWEPFADGTTNPWGIDWDDYGQGFVCNCVNPHLFHVIQGAHYEPWRNRDSSRYAYGRIPTIADHLHFVGGGDIRSGIGSEDEDAAGGGHAHCGTMVYLGDNWPEEYRGQIFMNNIHGRRVNMDLLKRKGSGYVASHGSDLMVSQDPWFMGVTLSYGPDGGVYVSDWSDTGECHSTRNTRRHTGRIYKITHGVPDRPRLNLAGRTDLELAELQSHRNDWYVRHARRLLQERTAAGRDMAEVNRALRRMFAEEPRVPGKLRALWAMAVTGGLDDEFLTEQSGHESEYVRAWAVCLLCEDREPSANALLKLRELAATGDSQFVRLYLASALQRLRPEQRWPIAEALVARAEDADDDNLPLMYWYAVEPLIGEDVGRFVSLAGAAEIPLIRRHIARRVADSTDDALGAPVRLLTNADDPARLDLLTGLLQGLEGRRNAPMPPAWRDAYTALTESRDGAVKDRATELALIFGDPVALRSLREQAADRSAPADDRNRAVRALVAKKGKDLPPLLLQLIADPACRSAALRGLAEYDYAGTADAILARYPNFDPAARQDALQTLASRKAWATAMLDAVESGHIPAGDLTAYTARQLNHLKDERITARLKSLWGDVRPAEADRLKLIAQYKRQLSPDTLSRADRTEGQLLFKQHCASCHRLFGEGETVGPDLTGSQRTNLDYVLENLIDPSASVAKDYQMEVIETATGRLITGLVVAETGKTLTVQTATEKVVVPKDEVVLRESSDVSLMPDGLLAQLSHQQVRDLIGYLAGRTE